MSAPQDQSFIFQETGSRPHVAAFVQRPQFHVGDKVKLLTSNGTREGPFLVASIPSVGMFTLCDEKTGQAVMGGKEFEVDYLEAAS